MKNYKDDFKLVKVKDLDVTGQLVFKDIEKFNRIQSEVFPVAYNTNENLLICAPTGAGKTNIALLAMVHQIKAHMIDNTVQHSNFKVRLLKFERIANFNMNVCNEIGLQIISFIETLFSDNLCKPNESLSNRDGCKFQ